MYIFDSKLTIETNCARERNFAAATTRIVLRISTLSTGAISNSTYGTCAQGSHVVPCERGLKANPTAAPPRDCAGRIDTDTDVSSSLSPARILRLSPPADCRRIDIPLKY